MILAVKNSTKLNLTRLFYQPLSTLIKCLLVILSLFVLGCSKQSNLYTLSGKTMGTTWSIKYIDYSPSLEKKNIDNRLIEINQIMSTYIPNSELSLLNKKPIKQWHSISTELYKIIKLSNEISKLTDGAFDITVGNAVNYLGFGAETTNKNSLKEIDYRNIKLKNNKIYLTHKSYIDLSAIAKGYAVDELALILEKFKVSNYLIEIGGEIKANGTNDNNQYWQIAIEEPKADKRSIINVISLKNQAIASSGSYRNFKLKNGVFISHTIDPTTGKSITHNTIATTVIHQSTAYADAFATALMVLGKEKGLKLSNKLKLKTMIVSGDIKQSKISEISYSETFHQKIEQ